MARCDTNPRRWHISRLLPAVSLLPLAFLLTSVCEAQIVVGHLFETGSRVPVDGALVVLVREGGAEEDGYLTNSAGRFRLTSSPAGQFRLRAERIGYATVISQPFELASGQVLGMNLETSHQPISLEGIGVQGEQRCVVRPEEGLALAQLWEEAGKALRVQEWTEQEGMYEYQVSNYQRELGPEARRVQAEMRETDIVVAQLPYRSLPVEELLTHGFIRPLEDGRFEFRAPDASVLLSDPFLDTHCFRLREDPDRPGSIGLSIEPTEETELSDIEGTLWLERGSARLQFLEYRYTDVPYPGANAAAGGRVDFEGLPNGTWIVKDWWIRMPQVTRFRWPGRRAINEYRVTSFKERGGEVRQVYSADQLVLREMPQGILTGAVWDSTRGQPLSGAAVSLSGTSHEAVTDSAGRFSMMELPEGVYTTAISHPILDTLGVVPPGVEVEITPDQVIDIELGIPSHETLLAMVCEAAPTTFASVRMEGNWDPVVAIDTIRNPVEEGFGTSVVVGTVRTAGTGQPIPKATVTIGWTKLVERNRVDFRLEYAITEKTDYGFDSTITDIDGRYVFCALPSETDLEVSAAFLEHEGDTVTVRAEPDSHVVRNLEIHLPPGMLNTRTSAEGLVPPGEQQGVQGRIIDPATGSPVPNAEVTLGRPEGGFQRKAITNSSGFFRVLSPWLGTFTLQATALGYKPVESDSLRIEPGELTVVEVEMPPEPIDLAPLVVLAEPRDFHLDTQGFYHRVEQGIGHFITPDEMEIRQPLDFADLLRDVPGLRISREGFSTRVLMPKPSMNVGGGIDLFCEPRIYVDAALVPQPRPSHNELDIGAYLDLAVDVNEVKGIEVHTRFTGVPLAYGGTQGSCGVILIWTK